MIYGLNFNGQDIPSEVKAAFKERIIRPVHGKRVKMIRVGCCQSDVELGLMLRQADNGKRGLYWVRDYGWNVVYVY